VIPLPGFLVNDKNCTKIVNTGVMKTRPSQQNKTNIFARNNSERSNALNQFFTNFLNNKTEKSFSNLAASQFCFSRSNKSTTTLQFRILQGCVIVALQGCVIVALQGCVIVAL
jgi:hypothetical protein